MQMFNGCTMWVLGYWYRVNFDGLESGDKPKEWASENFEEKVNKTIDQINQITVSLTKTETNTETDEDSWKKLLDSLNSSLTESMENYFRKNPEKLKNLKTAVESSIAKLKENNKWELPAKYKDLENFLNRINQLLPNNPEEGPKSPELWLKKDVKLEWVKAVVIGEWDPEDKKWEQKFHKWIDKKEEWQEKSALDVTREDLKWQIDSIKTIDVSKLPENVKGEIEQLQNLLVSMNNVLDNTTIDNVKLLQNFISDNLEWEDKTKFDKASKKANGQFDWMFGDGTLAWLKLVLEKTWKYIDDVKELLKQSETPDNLDKVQAKKNATVQKDAEIKPEDLVEGVSEWITVTLDGWQELKTDVVDKEIDVKLTAKSWEKEKPLVVKVRVVEKTSANPETTPQQPINVPPLKLNGGEYPAKPESQTIAQNARLNWAIFYDAGTVEGGEHLADWDFRCYMKIEWNPSTYEVWVDRNWNISPVAINVDSKKSVLLKNNESCKKYLANKIPASLSPRPVIWWSDNKQDYSIQSYNESLTIEPMTIRGRWVSRNLSDCLTLLNFTNFLKGSGMISDIKFKNNDPDLELRKDGNLYVRVNRKSNRIYDEDWNVIKMGGWYKVPMARFWLDNISNKEDVLKKYIKYNNGEHWNDKWDKKKKNKYFRKI